MKFTVKLETFGSVVLSLGLLAACSAPAQPTPKMDPVAPNGIELPAGFSNWRSIAVSHRTDNNSLRLILGNDIAVQAAASGHTAPWPTGSILGKLVWKDGTHEQWPAATVPEAFVHAEFMIKDPARFAATGGWGYARFLGGELVPYGEDESFVQECYGCHTPVADQDYVFTKPPVFPGR
jgi:hypothetical protein